VITDPSPPPLPAPTLHASPPHPPHPTIFSGIRDGHTAGSHPGSLGRAKARTVRAVFAVNCCRAGPQVPVERVFERIQVKEIPGAPFSLLHVIIEIYIHTYIYIYIYIYDIIECL
jgi:hypothetical protein